VFGVLGILLTLIVHRPTCHLRVRRPGHFAHTDRAQSQDDAHVHQLLPDGVVHRRPRFPRPTRVSVILPLLLLIINYYNNN